MTEEEKTQAREYLTWLTESVAKLGLGQDVIERRLTYPHFLVELGKTTISRLPGVKPWEVPDVVHRVQELLGGSEDEKNRTLTAIAQVYFREFREKEPETGEESNLWYH